MDRIYIIEHRQWDWRGLDGGLDHVIAHVSDSLPKAVVWIRKNKDYQEREHVWWWAVHPEDVDQNTTHKLLLFNWDGKEIENPPTEGGDGVWEDQDLQKKIGKSTVRGKQKRK